MPYLFQNNLLNIQKKFNSAPDFARHGNHFGLFDKASSCLPPLVKGEDTEQNKTAGKCFKFQFLLCID